MIFQYDSSDNHQLLTHLNSASALEFLLKQGERDRTMNDFM